MTKDVSKKNDKKDATQKIEGIICRLKSKRLQMPDVPEEFRMHPDILRAERKLEIRKSGHRGFDVIRQLFFLKKHGVIKTGLASMYPENIRKNLILFKSIMRLWMETSMKMPAIINVCLMTNSLQPSSLI